MTRQIRRRDFIQAAAVTSAALVTGGMKTPEPGPPLDAAQNSAPQIAGIDDKLPQDQPDQKGETMSNPIFAMDTCFYHPTGWYEFDVRCEMLAELGYDGTYLTLWNEPAWGDLSKLPSVKDRYGLDVAGVWAAFNIARDEKHKRNRRILDMIESVEGCANVELALRASPSDWKQSDPSGDEAALRWLEQIAETAAKRDITISLYHHVDWWLERASDAVRLCAKLNHPNLKAVFCGFHWYAIEGKDPAGCLKSMVPHLHSVNLCGSRRMPDQPRPTIEPLDEGELDNFQIMGILREIGYSGSVGVQGYSVGGDAYAILRRSLIAYRDIEQRLDDHPNWAKLRNPVSISI